MSLSPILPPIYFRVQRPSAAKMTTPNPKPTVIIVPGAHHTPFHFKLLQGHLERAGFPTACIGLPSNDSSTPLEDSLAKDASHIRENAVLPELDQKGNNVILIGHSYGAPVAGAAAHGLGPADRGDGQTAVLGIINMCGFIVASHTTPYRPGSPRLAWAIIHDEKTMTVDDPANVFYNDVEDQAAVQAAIDALVAYSFPPFFTESPPQAHQAEAFKGRLAYIRTIKDNALKTELQDFFLSDCEVKWPVETLDSGHSPFMSRPNEVVAIVDKYAKQWA